MLRTVDSPKVKDVHSTATLTSTVSKTIEPKMTLRKDARRRRRITVGLTGVSPIMVPEDNSFHSDEQG